MTLPVVLNEFEFRIVFLHFAPLQSGIKLFCDPISDGKGKRWVQIKLN